MNIIDIGTYALYSGFPPLVLFAIFYGIGSRWWRYPEGKALFAAKLSLSLVVSTVILTLLFGPDYPGRGAVRLVCYGAFSVAEWWLLWRLLATQRVSRKEETDLREELAEATRREGLESNRGDNDHR